MPAVNFIANIPQFVEDLNNDQPRLIDDMIVHAIAYTAFNGMVIAADIITLTWKGTDVTKYVSECQPETWERLKDAARAYYPPSSPNVTS